MAPPVDWTCVRHASPSVSALRTITRTQRTEACLFRDCLQMILGCVGHRIPIDQPAAYPIRLVRHPEKLDARQQANRNSACGRRHRRESDCTVRASSLLCLYKHSVVQESA